MTENLNSENRAASRAEERARRRADREARRARKEGRPAGTEMPAESPAPALAPQQPVAPGANVVPAPQSTVMDINQWRYPEYDFSREDVTSAPTLKFTSYANDPSMHYEWDDAGEGEYYRVVTSDVAKPEDPDEYDTIGLTTDTRIADTRPPSGPYRYVTVWGYTYDEARPGYLGQCRLIAWGVYVYPVSDWVLEFNESVLLSNWSVERPPLASGASVEVVYARIDGGENVRKTIKSGTWLLNPVPSDGTGFLNGFTDPEVIQGRSYTYICAVQVQFPDGTKSLSKALHQTMMIDADVAPKVTDLVVDPDADDSGNYCRIIWTQPPVGEVRIYRLQDDPDREALSAAQIPIGALEQIGLNSETLLNFPASALRGEDARGRFEISRALWPDGDEWDRITFVPVTFLHDKAAIGTHVTLRRSGKIDAVKVIQRMDWQLVTFRWPGDAHSVELRIADSVEMIDDTQPPHFVVEREVYKASGGFVIPPPGLSPRGCVLQLRSVALFKGEKSYGKPVNHTVGSLWKYSYTVDWPLMSRGMLKHIISRPLEVTVTPRSGCVPLDFPMSFCLVHNPEHLPIDMHDGKTLEVCLTPPDDINVETSTSIIVNGEIETKVWVNHLDQEVKTGYVRLFPLVEAAARYASEYEYVALEHFAVDPPYLNDLRVK